MFTGELSPPLLRGFRWCLSRGFWWRLDILFLRNFGVKGTEKLEVIPHVRFPPSAVDDMFDRVIRSAVEAEISVAERTPIITRNDAEHGILLVKEQCIVQ